MNTLLCFDGDLRALYVAENTAKYARESPPAWTVVGTTVLFIPHGIVEIEIAAYSPV